MINISLQVVIVVILLLHSRIIRLIRKIVQRMKNLYQEEVFYLSVLSTTPRAKWSFKRLLAFLLSERAAEGRVAKRSCMIDFSGNVVITISPKLQVVEG